MFLFIYLKFVIFFSAVSKMAHFVNNGYNINISINITIFQTMFIGLLETYKSIVFIKFVALLTLKLILGLPCENMFSQPGAISN